MKTDRFVALVTAGLITLLLAGVLAHEKVGASQEQTHAAGATNVATDTRSTGVERGERLSGRLLHSGNGHEPKRYSSASS